MGLFSFFTNQQSTSPSGEDTKDFSANLTTQMYRQVLDTSSTMTLFFSRQDGWVDANKIFFETFNIDDMKDFRTHFDSVRELFLGESEEVFTEDDKSWLDYIKKYKPEGFAVTISTDNDLRFINVKCHQLPSNRDLYVVEFEDVTHVKKAEQKIQEVEKLKSKFLANIGHEFRTPMNGILGFIELISHTNLTPQQQEYMGMINRSSRNLMSNIENLLDLSQMQGGRLHLVESSFSLLEEMEDIVRHYSMQGQEKGVSVLSFIDPKLPRELHGDYRKIKQIMGSLLQNAVKFTDRGGKVIFETKLLKRAVNGDCSIGFSVKDNGKGIATEKIQLITEPFHAGNHADERLGVGLSLANGLVELLGSKLHIKSEEGQGSYFNFALDFKASKGQAFKMMPKSKAKVLLLDPKRVNEANFLSIYLRSFALDVVKANNFDENVYHGIDTLYVIADQKDSTWMLKLGTFSKKSSHFKKASVVLVLDEGEKLQSKLTYLVDEVIHKPLLPSSMYKHLSKIHTSEEQKEKQLELNKEHVALVVEDNLINQRLIQILLKEYKLKVRTAGNGNEAVMMAAKEKFDIIFMDIDMPEKDGVTATQEIKESVKLNQKTPIVALTALAMEGDKERLLAEGLDEYMSKPLTRDKLENIMSKYLEVHH